MTSQPLYNIPRGSILQLDGRELTVSVREESGYAVECKETGECFTLSLERVETAIRNRDCEIIKPADVEKRMALLEHTDGLEFVEQLSDKDQRIVQARLALVIAQDELRAEGVKLTQRSMNKGSAELSHDQLYGTITRYFVDEYPFRPHRGTGMFGATPRQKREEALRRYGPIEAPSQRSRCLHLGEKVRATTTSEGVRAFNIPFNSKALQDLAAGTAKEVTVHLDPDDLRKVYVTAEGDEEVAETRLSMTIFKDQSLEEAIEIMENATASNPSLRVLHEENLSEAMQRRATESGFFPDSRDPLSYRKIEQLRRRADKLHQVEARPAAYIGATAAPGQLMSRGRASGVVPARPAGIMRGKSDAEVLSVLDAFKTLMKSHDWPLMLILSGVPELGGYVQREPQLDRLMTRIEFQEIDLSSAPGHPAQDYETLNEIVGSYAISAGLYVDASLPTGDFLHRLATAGAFRWGLVIDMVVDAVALAVARREGVVERSDFVAAWCEKTGMNQLATPFTHDSYERMFRRDKPFRAAIGT